MKNNLFFKLIIIIFIVGCDFSSGLHKDILKAQDFISERNFQKAAVTYEGILKRKASKNIRIKIHYQLAEIYSVYLNNYEAALKNLNNIIIESNEPLWQVKALEKIGDISFENLKDYDSSLKTYRKLSRFIPKLEKQDYYIFRYSQSLFHLGRYVESDKLMKDLTISSSGEPKIRSFYYLGLSHFYRKDWDASISYWFEYLKRETRKDHIINVKFLIANAYESSENLKEAYNIYYSIIGEYPNPEVIKNRLNSLYQRRVARKR
tara:strand:- start:207935 stop:208723 length:789 start_codon:yes stop_codon:yes gene_type:complete